MRFSFIASTGRTATTFLARVLDGMPGVAACHEGYRAGDKDVDPVLPLINLENRRAYHSPDCARKVVAAKRNETILREAAVTASCDTLIDVAYYNAMICEALLAELESSRMIGVIRKLTPFVRSATAMEGEDDLPVGWARADKPLTGRERFIQMGRIRPKDGTPDAESWAAWSAVSKNIWLWRETNLRVLQARDKHRERVLIMRFERLESEPTLFLSEIASHFGLALDDPGSLLAAGASSHNRKRGGYQIGERRAWSVEEQVFADEAEALIEDKL